MGNAFSADTMPVLVTLVDVHNAKARDQYYFAMVSSGGVKGKVVGRSQTLAVEVAMDSVLTLSVYDCPEPRFCPEVATFVGTLKIPIRVLSEKYSSGLFQQWFNLDTRHPDMQSSLPVGTMSMSLDAELQLHEMHTSSQRLGGNGYGGSRSSGAGALSGGTSGIDATQFKFERAFVAACEEVYAPKVCVSVLGSRFEVRERPVMDLFVDEDVVREGVGPDVQALVASHKQQAAYIDALHEELRRLNVPSYRPIFGSVFPVGGGGASTAGVAGGAGKKGVVAPGLDHEFEVVGSGNGTAHDERKTQRGSTTVFREVKDSAGVSHYIPHGAPVGLDSRHTTHQHIISSEGGAAQHQQKNLPPQVLSIEAAETARLLQNNDGFFVPTVAGRHVQEPLQKSAGVVPMAGRPPVAGDQGAGGVVGLVNGRGNNGNPSGSNATSTQPVVASAFSLPSFRYTASSDGRVAGGVFSPVIRSGE